MASFTSKDMSDTGKYAGERKKLFELTRAVALFPQIFSHTVVEVRAANAGDEETYRFEPSFTNNAIEVSIDWTADGRGCSNASCYQTFPRGERCTYEDNRVRLFPSGLKSDVVGCNPACFASKRVRDFQMRQPKLLLTDDDDPRRCVECDSNFDNVPRLSRKSIAGTWYDLTFDQSAGKWIDDGVSPTVPSSKRTDESTQNTDLPLFAWSNERQGCTLGNVQLWNFLVEPFTRDPSHNVCRLTNFELGDDVVIGDGDQITGTHDATYCGAFDKDWNPSTLTCDETWWNRVLGYSFFGSAIVRLAKHAIDGGDGCDAFFRPKGGDGERSRETYPGVGGLAGNETTYLYEKWRSDVNTNFRVPPPNIQLSDLGIDPRITGNLLYWHNLQYHEDGKGLLARFPLIQNIRVTSRNLYVSSYQDAKSSLRKSDSFRSTDAVLRNAGDVPANGPRSDYDDIAKTINDMTSDDIVTGIVRDLGIQLGIDVIEAKIAAILKRYAKRLLAFTARQFAGKASRLLLKCGVRYGLASLIGTVSAQFTTRALIALGTISTGVGIVIGIIEFLSLVLDVALLFGWDPGNYNSEFDLRIYADFAFQFLKAKTFLDIRDITPSDLIHLFLLNPNNETASSAELGEGANQPIGNVSTDEDDENANGNEEVVNVNERFTVARWFNRDWPQCFEKPTNGQAAAVMLAAGTSRMPLVDGDFAVIVASWHYLGSFTTNSYGQYVTSALAETDEWSDDNLADTMQYLDYANLVRETKLSGITVQSKGYSSRASIASTAKALLALAVLTMYASIAVVGGGDNLLSSIFVFVAISLSTAALVVCTLLSQTPLSYDQLFDGKSIPQDVDKITYKNLASHLLDNLRN